VTWLAGVDGCRAGWVMALVRPEGPEAVIRVVPRFTDVLAEAAAIIAVDMPIGLPERAGPGGRGPEQLVRPKLPGRSSSVFSVPSRAAIYADDYAAACRIALATSDPPRALSRQLFNIMPKIREVDAALRADPPGAARVFESHPELAFCRLNAGRPAPPKKTADGIALRRALLAAAGLAADGPAPRGAGIDDMLDALACATVARRLYHGEALSYPAQPPSDAHGLPIAIWT
jgi:predicted RNase H-like nuclease